MCSTTSPGSMSGKFLPNIPERRIADSTSMPTASSGTLSDFATRRAHHFAEGTKYASPPREAWAISSEVSFMHAESTSFMNVKLGGIRETAEFGSDQRESGMDDMPFMRELYAMPPKNATCRTANGERCGNPFRRFAKTRVTDTLCAIRPKANSRPAPHTRKRLPYPAQTCRSSIFTSTRIIRFFPAFESPAVTRNGRKNSACRR